MNKGSTTLLAGFAFIIAAALAGRAGGATGSAISGYQPYVNVVGNQTVEVLPTASVSYLDAYNQATVNIQGGAIGWLNLHDSSVTNIYGGDISWLKLYDSGRANLHSVQELSWLLLNESSEAHIYGRDFRYGFGHLSGTWANGAHFSFWALNESDLANPTSDRSLMPTGIKLHVIPEATAAALATLAAPLAFLGRRRTRTRRGQKSC
jgi:hypothetical protein